MAWRTVADIQAFLETLVVETLTIENSINRNRTLTSIAASAAKLLEVGELADRIEALEAASRVTRSAATPSTTDDADRSATMAMRLVELDGGLPFDEQPGTQPTEARIEAGYADLLEVARIKALADQGEGHASVARTQRWLAGKRPL